MKFILGMEMRYGQKKTPINFGGGQWSWGVTVGLTLKSLLSRYLELGNLCKVHTWHGDAFWSKEKNLSILVEVKGHGGSRGSNSENHVNMIS